MNKFMKALLIKDTGIRFPLIDKVRVDNFNLDFNEHTINKFEKEWTAKLIYQSRCRMPSDRDDVEFLIKEKLLNEISWELYGDAINLLRALRKALIKDDKDYCLELISELSKEIEGRR